GLVRHSWRPRESRRSLCPTGQLQFLCARPALDFYFPFERRAFRAAWFRVDDPFGAMRTGIASAPPRLMGLKPALDIVGDAGINAAVRTLQEIEIIHVQRPEEKRKKRSGIQAA